jgi:prepilin-type N-terminal cleavage/methylation domain-containing protein
MMQNLNNADKGMGSNHQDSVRWPFGQEGFSLMELLVTTAIFSILLAGVFGAYFSQLDHSTREYRVAESEVELGIAKRIIEHDLEMSGYGLAGEYSGSATAFNPMPVTFDDATGPGGADELFLMGTALGLSDRVSQGWSYVVDFDASSPPKVNIRDDWADARELIGDNDRVVMVDPSSKNLLTDSGGNWLFKYTVTGTTTDIVNLAGTPFSSDIGSLVYGLYGSGNSGKDTTVGVRPYYTVHYYLGSTSPSDNPDLCAPGTGSLLRAESVTTEAPSGGDPLLACVRDFQVAVGLDTNGNGMVDNWDDDNSIIGVVGFTRENMNDQLKRIKVFLLIQSGNRDSDYTYPLSTIRVGEGTTIGRDITLTAEQRKYRWRLVSLSVQPRNVR